jgi:hypothetical protein
VLHDPALYAKLSLKSDSAWKSLQLPVTMGRLLEAWISESLADAEWIRGKRLMSGQYDDQIRALRMAR